MAGVFRHCRYSGTDPFDNPQYERFIEDFAAVNGYLPYTSTALAVRDPERTRRLLAVSGPNQLRFSVLSLGMLTRIHAEFAPEELLLVEIGPRNEGSIQSRFMGFAGRAREHLKIYKRNVPGEPSIHSPSCESGFKFNLVDRVVQLQRVPARRMTAGPWGTASTIKRALTRPLMFATFSKR